MQLRRFKILIVVILLLLPLTVTADEVIGVDNLISNSNFDENLNQWTLEPDIRHEKIDGSMVISMNGKYRNRKGYIDQNKASYCVSSVPNAEFRLSARFRYQSLPVTEFGHRANIVWYSEENCRGGGQYGSYIEPEPHLEWQKLTSSNLIPSLDVKSARITLAQNLNTSRKQMSTIDRVQKWFYELIGLDFELPLSVGYWDDVSLIAIKAIQKNEIPSLLRPNKPKGYDYLVNGGFDEDDRGWNSRKFVNWIDSTDDSHSGVLHSILRTTGAGMGTGVFQQCINFGSEQLFEMGISYRIDPLSNVDGGGRMRVTWMSGVDCRGQWKISGKHANLSQNAGWQKLHVEDLAPPQGSHSVIIELIQSIKGPGESAIFWDDAFFRVQQ